MTAGGRRGLDRMNRIGRIFLKKPEWRAEAWQNHGQQNHFLGGMARCRAGRVYGRGIVSHVLFFSRPPARRAYGSERSGVPREHGRLGRAGAESGSLIDEVAVRVSFTVETTVLPSFARQRGACSGVSMSAGRASSSHVPFFSRAAASQGSMAVSAVQAQRVVRSSMRLRRGCLTRSRRPCSPLVHRRCRARNSAISLSRSGRLSCSVLCPAPGMIWRVLSTPAFWSAWWSLWLWMSGTMSS